MKKKHDDQNKKISLRKMIQFEFLEIIINPEIPF